MKILIACEESQEVCRAFRELGFEAYSCDLQECSGGKKRGQSYSIGVSNNAKESSKTFSGVAKAMAEQWGTFIRSRKWNNRNCLYGNEPKLYYD